MAARADLLLPFCCTRVCCTPIISLRRASTQKLQLLQETPLSLLSPGPDSLLWVSLQKRAFGPYPESLNLVDSAWPPQSMTRKSSTHMIFLRAGFYHVCSLGQRAFSCLKQWTLKVEKKFFNERLLAHCKVGSTICAQNLVFNRNLLSIDCERYCSLVIGL